ncbi:MAG: hypothetical protein V1857_01565 [archaeon]
MSIRRYLCLSICIIVTTLVALQSATPNVVSAAASVIETDRPVYAYNAKEVLLSGSGLSVGKYYIWLKGPGENQSRFTGESFDPTGGGNVPYPNVRVPLDQRALGTYLVSLSTQSTVNNEVAKAIFGLFGSTKSVYERREILQVVGGGAFPGSTIRIDIRNPRDVLAHNVTAVVDEKGDFTYAWYLESNVPTGSWLLSVNGLGTYDDIGERWHVDAQFGVKAAWLRINIYGQLSSTYQRTQKATIAFTVKYPDGSPVLTIKKDLRLVTVTTEETSLLSLPVVLTDSLNGVWIAEYTTARNETILRNCSFAFSAGAFDDGYGNIGPSAAIKSATFTIVPAQLVVTIKSKGSYEIIFDRISLNASVTYPDGSRMTDGVVSVHIKSGRGNETLAAAYNSQNRDWRISRQLGLSDILLIGRWSIEFTASDNFGNTGIGSVEFDIGMLWFVVSIIAASVIILVLVKWVSEEKTLIKRRSKTKTGETSPSSPSTSGAASESSSESK